MLLKNHVWERIGMFCLAYSCVVPAFCVQIGKQAASRPVASTVVKNSFDVVSIKASDPKAPRSGRTWAHGYRASNLIFGELLFDAYFPIAYEPQMEDRRLIQGAPDWVWKERFDIVAKVDGANLSEYERQARSRSFTNSSRMLQEMLQSALAERCKLIAHRVPGEIAGYKLIVDRHGVNAKKLLRANSDEKIPPNATPLPGAEDTAWMAYGARQNGASEWLYYQTSMQEFVGQLFTYTGFPIEDAAGLEGKFDFSLFVENGHDFANAIDLAALGLKLVPIKIPIEAVVIDHMERPTEN
jgi:uncharacterized protein (TIGR03435 family)